MYVLFWCYNYTSDNNKWNSVTLLAELTEKIAIQLQKAICYQCLCTWTFKITAARSKYLPFARSKWNLHAVVNTQWIQFNFWHFSDFVIDVINNSLILNTEWLSLLVDILVPEDSWSSVSLMAWLYFGTTWFSSIWEVYFSSGSIFCNIYFLRKHLSRRGINIAVKIQKFISLVGKRCDYSNRPQ